MGFVLLSNNLHYVKAWSFCLFGFGFVCFFWIILSIKTVKINSSWQTSLSPRKLASIPPPLCFASEKNSSVIKAV